MAATAMLTRPSLPTSTTLQGVALVKRGGLISVVFTFISNCLDVPGSAPHQDESPSFTVFWKGLYFYCPCTEGMNVLLLIKRDAATSWGRGLAWAGMKDLCRQPLGYAMYNRPITTKFNQRTALVQGLCGRHRAGVCEY